MERRAEPPTYRQQVQKAVDPATFEMIGTVPITHEAQIPGLVAQARRAAEAWGNVGPGERAKALRGLRVLIADRADDIAPCISRNMGKPLFESYSNDVAMVLDHLDDYIARAGEYLADQPVALAPRLGSKQAFIRYEPRGVVCVIAPWNYPFELAMTPALTALAAGNAVIIKPTSAAPMVGEVVEQLFSEALRDWPSLVQVAHGPGKLGTALATADGVDFVMFTGSTQVGRQLQVALAPLLRPCIMELGGSDPMIVCEDANLERAANGAVFGRFTNNGQVCAAVKRVYVNALVAREFTRRVVEKVKTLRLGAPVDREVDVGPLANDRAIGSLRALLHDALDKGAKLEAGGFPAIQSGWYWPPTVISNVDHSMRIMKEESFGPILPIQTVVTDEEALELANDTDYGLDAYVFTQDLKRAHRLARRLKAGSVDINDVFVNYAVRDLPFGGVKDSGIGRYHGKMGLRAFCQVKSLVVDDGAQDSDPTWFPYTEEKLDRIRKDLKGESGRI
jgi:acyl-CoA reductase-like NAD-dependent aldehyde dehydrogenase